MENLKPEFFYERTLEAVRTRLKLPRQALTRTKGVLHGIIAAVSGLAYEVSMTVLRLQKQMSPLTATVDWLPYWSSALNAPQTAAVSASGSIILAGNGNVPAGTLFTRSDGTAFKTRYAAVAPGSVVVDAVAGGMAGNTAADTPLTLTVAVPGLGGSHLVDANGITGGAEAETIDEWRQRLNDIWLAGQMLGDKEDYAAILRSTHPDVTHAFIDVNYPGYIYAWIGLADRIDPIPDQALLDIVAEGFDAQRNLVAVPSILPIETEAIDMEIAGVPLALQESVTAEIRDEIRHQWPRGPKLKQQILNIGTIYQRMIAIAPDASIISPLAAPVSENGKLLDLGVITWI